MKKRPRGEMASRPLHFIWIADCSGSTRVDGKIQALNNAIRESTPHMRNVADDDPNAQALARAIRLSTGAQWHLVEPKPIHDFQWKDLSAGGVTDMGQALKLLTDQLRIPPMSDRALPPVLVAVSDGRPTDDSNAELGALLKQPSGKKSVRLAIAIGGDDVSLGLLCPQQKSTVEVNYEP